MGQTIRDGAPMGMTDSEREAEINRVRRLLAEAQLDDDYEAQSRWARNLAELLRAQSGKVLEALSN